MQQKQFSAYFVVSSFGLFVENFKGNNFSIRSLSFEFLTYFSRTFCLSSICTSKISVYFFLIFRKKFALLEFRAGLLFGRGHSFQELCFTFFKVTHRFLSLRHLIFCFSATMQNHTSNQTKKKVFQAWYLFLER